MNKEKIKQISDKVMTMSERECLQVIVKLLLEILKKGK